MNKVRIGIVGVGLMGATHARSLLEGRAPGLELVALCDDNPSRLAPFAQVRHFSSAPALIASGGIEALLIATPHYAHTTVGIAALQAGLHVLVEKPISVHKADALRLLEAARGRRKQVFAVMFNQRTDPFYQRIRALIQSGELGAIQRINWIVTNWFRPGAYYAAGGWRATWAGEGGGVLLNQCPHNLDLLQWLFGMPKRVRAFCGFGRYHQIEVEDDVTAYLEYANGATGVFITSTGEAPGTNRLEIMADRGRLVYEDDRLSFIRNETPTAEFSRTTTALFAAPPTWNVAIPISGHGGQHNEILQNFAAAILDGAPLIAPATEGIHSVELANAMLLSAWTDKTIELPMNAAGYERRLRQRIKPAKTAARSTSRKVPA